MRKLPERDLMPAIHLAFEQDPKYAIRLLVDIAIKALCGGRASARIKCYHKSVPKP